MGKGIRLATKVVGVMVLVLPLVIGVMLVPKADATLGITVSKDCRDAVGPGEPITFYGQVCNTGLYPLVVTVEDDHAIPALVFGPTTINPGDCEPYEGSYYPTISPSTNIVTATGTYTEPGTVYTVTDTDDATCFGNFGGGGEGCTPGYWKNHLGAWGPTGYSTGDKFDTVFGVSMFGPNITLLQALNQGGGGIYALGRHGVAALLSAAHPGVDYPLTIAEVITAVQSGNKDLLERSNELGCPLGAADLPQ